MFVDGVRGIEFETAQAEVVHQMLETLNEKINSDGNN